MQTTSYGKHFGRVVLQTDTITILDACRLVKVHALNVSSFLSRAHASHPRGLFLAFAYQPCHHPQVVKTAKQG
jgi:hypothetical protein